MKFYKKIYLSIFVSTSLFALPDEGQLILPADNNVVQEENINSLNENNNIDLANDETAYKKALETAYNPNQNQGISQVSQTNTNKNINSSDDIIQLLDDVNKKRLEYEELRNRQKEEEKLNDKDYVLEQAKKDNEIYEETLKKVTNDEKMKQKQKDIAELEKSDYEEFHDNIKTRLNTLRDIEKNFFNEYKVDGIYSLKVIGDQKSIIIPTASLYEAIERLLMYKKDLDNVRNQIKYYESALQSKNKDYLKEVKEYEELYTKTEVTTLKTVVKEESRTELKEGDMVYQNIYITNISKNSYTLVIK